MQVTKIMDLMDGNSGSWSGDQGREYANSILVFTDDPRVGARAVLQALGLYAGMPYRFPLYLPATEYDYGAFISRVEPRRAGSDKGTRWEVAITYSQYDWGSQSGAQADGTFNPFDAAIQVRTSYETYERAALKDTAGNAILNNVGDPFDPGISGEDNRLLITLVRNERTCEVMTSGRYKGRVNSETFLGFDANTVKCKNISADRQYSPDWGTYWQITYEFELRLYEEHGNNGWSETVLNAGLRQKSADGSKVEQVRIDGAPVSSPVALNADGRYEPGSDPVYMVYDILPDVDLNELGFPDDVLSASALA